MEIVSLPVSVSILHNNLVSSSKYLGFVTNIKPNPQIHLLSLETLRNNPSTQLVKYKNEEEVLHINYVEVNTK